MTRTLEGMETPFSYVDRASMASTLHALVLGVTGVVLSTATAPAQQLRATFIGNAAFHLTDGRVAVLTDFPYESGAFGSMPWSSTTVPTGPAPLCIVSHAHADHFAADRAAEFCGTLLGPRDVVRSADVDALELQPRVRWEGVTIHAFRTPHASIEHYSFLLEWAGQRLYFTGDTNDTEALLAARDLDVAFVTPWLLEAVHRAGRQIDARRIVVHHHRIDESVPGTEESVVPSQGEVLTLGRASHGR